MIKDWQKILANKYKAEQLQANLHEQKGQSAWRCRRGGQGGRGVHWLR